ncbi:hypothetical protein ACFFU1_16585 [Algibacter miyuki]|uniref:Uncharacterized protein n=1 Tax=Algibacter miyuki TaxID=1306933 RepID=A0ABV5H3P5_9FLAO|nr:hypothetical protein [Algibacter miyuki]MDN3665596.1 hypothetical protein [Algibacter miyuki]
MIKVGEIKEVKNKGLEFKIQAIDEEFIVIDDGTGKATPKRLGEVITDVPENPFGIKKGIKMIMSE